MSTTATPSKDKQRGKGRKILNDNLGDGFEAFLTDACTNLVSVTKGAIYIAMSSSELHTLQRAFTAAGGKWSTFVIWAKHAFTLGRADYQRQYEPILYGWRDGAEHYWCGARDQGDVWFFDKPARNDLHPTMKPVALVERAIRNSSKARDIVLDPFGGSGSTLIAAEKTGRQARLVELDPAYCDVIVQRWQRFSGRAATLDGDGRSFDELAAAAATGAGRNARRACLGPDSCPVTTSRRADRGDMRSDARGMIHARSDLVGIVRPGIGVLLLTPGPAVLYIVARSVAQGRAAGLVRCSASIGTIVHDAAAVGLSAVVVSSALAFAVVKYLGAACLIWLGIRTLTSKDPDPDTPRRADWAAASSCPHGVRRRHSTRRRRSASWTILPQLSIPHRERASSLADTRPWPRLHGPRDRQRRHVRSGGRRRGDFLRRSRRFLRFQRWFAAPHSSVSGSPPRCRRASDPPGRLARAWSVHS